MRRCRERPSKRQRPNYITKKRKVMKTFHFYHIAKRHALWACRQPLIWIASSIRHHFAKKSWCLSIARLFLLPKKENSVKQVTVQMRNKPSNKRRTSNKMSGCCCCLLNPLMLWFSSRNLLIQFRKYISVLNQLPLSRIGSYCSLWIRELHASQFFVCQKNFQRDARVRTSQRATRR